MNDHFAQKKHHEKNSCILVCEFEHAWVTDSDLQHVSQAFEHHCTVSFQLFDQSMTVEGEFSLLQRGQLHFPYVIRAPAAGHVQPCRKIQPAQTLDRSDRRSHMAGTQPLYL